MQHESADRGEPRVGRAEGVVASEGPASGTLAAGRGVGSGVEGASS
ncbi:hypothetical protein [Halorarum salinum]|uniref:Uncharacterized protein n=1 Tax=Halorarum salinum TaxID=2743089 RepID=A0A7D5QFF9_9EURY|nr:hypothetical protein [Halobaculum salinum]QLG61403.1 hypothetical protein HUG12_06510 [Halobaculum salinum]